MVVECIGLPGSGKTYLFRAVEEELKKNGISCVNGGELSMHSLWWKAGKKVLHRVIFLSRDARRLRERLKEILEREKPLQSRYGINMDERFTLESAAIFAAVYKRMEKSDKVYLFDEGLVHTIVKFCAEFHLPDEVFLAMVEECGPRQERARIVVYNEISIEECLRSIQKRDRHVCSFDELPQDRLKELLAQYERLNACYAANEPVVTVMRTEPGEEKTARILTKIRKGRAALLQRARRVEKKI